MHSNTPKNHIWVETGDGTKTLFSERFQEACHSTTGAKEETLLHYLKGCQVEQKISLENVTILEVGFGLGLGFTTTLETLKNAQHEFHFISLEIDHELVDWVFDDLARRNILSSIKKNPGLYEATHARGKLTVILGDARTSLPEFLKHNPQTFDVIYQDAFSPKKNPTLWTTQWFELLKKYSSDDVVLSTYSASSSIRKSMITSGWKIHKGEKFGPKRTSTRATLSGETDPEISLHLERSPTPALTDENVTEYANEKQTL